MATLSMNSGSLSPSVSIEARGYMIEAAVKEASFDSMGGADSHPTITFCVNSRGKVFRAIKNGKQVGLDGSNAEYVEFIEDYLRPSEKSTLDREDTD